MEICLRFRPASRHFGSFTNLAVSPLILPSAIITSLIGRVWERSDSNNRHSESGRPIVGTMALIEPLELMAKGDFIGC
jgi:hypothetical protein